jgi:hypothetical protein
MCSDLTSISASITGKFVSTTHILEFDSADLLFDSECLVVENKYSFVDVDFADFFISLPKMEHPPPIWKPSLSGTNRCLLHPAASSGCFCGGVDFWRAAKFVFFSSHCFGGMEKMCTFVGR